MQIKLNLIPPYKKEEIKKACRLRKVLRWETELFFVMALFVGTLFSMNYILKINLETVLGVLDISSGNDQYEAIEKFDNDIKDMNKLVSDTAKIQSGQLYWSKFLIKIQDKVFSGIGLENISTKNYVISLTGKADTRDNLLVFKDAIGKDECFASVNLPLSDLVSKDNIVFKMEFQFKKECLK